MEVEGFFLYRKSGVKRNKHKRGNITEYTWMILEQLHVDVKRWRIIYYAERKAWLQTTFILCVTICVYNQFAVRV